MSLSIVLVIVVAMIWTPESAEWTSGTWVTGYWDCCKPSCSWQGKGRVDQPVRACHKDTGLKLTRADANARSVCDGGISATCADNQPFMVSKHISMGFAAAAVGGKHGLTGDANCGQCFQLKFVDKAHLNADGWSSWGGAHPLLVNKSHIIQVTNIGYDVSGEHSFDLMIPGAGQGLFTTGCAAQFPGKSSGAFDCDNNYGGCSSKSGCEDLPKELQSGCEWRFNWFKWLTKPRSWTFWDRHTNNPYVKFRRVKCPAELVKISGSTPLDDDEYPSVELPTKPCPEIDEAVKPGAQDDTDTKSDPGKQDATDNTPDDCKTDPRKGRGEPDEDDGLWLLVSLVFAFLALPVCCWCCCFRKVLDSPQEHID